MLMKSLYLVLVFGCACVFAGYEPAPQYDDSICNDQLTFYLESLRSSTSQKWPIQMFDASSKLPSGLLAGNLVDLGQFEECLQISYSSDNETVNGQYCLLKIPFSIFSTTKQDRILLDPPNNPQLTLSICVPDKCSPEYLQENIQKLLYTIDEKTKNKLHLNITSISLCQTRATQDTMNGSDWGVISFFIIILLLVFLSTTYDFYCEYKQREYAHIILIAFSLKYNCGKLTSTSKNPNQLSCLNGIRFISMLWVIYGHTFTVEVYRPIINFADIKDWMNNAWHMHLLGATVSVDSFFVLSGLLLSYGYLQAKEKGVKFNIFMFYLHRYLRLTPVLAVIVLFHATLLDHFGSGPFWPVATAILKEPCKKNWWLTLLYFQNYFHTDKMCVGQTWYLGVDTQLYILAPILLIPLCIWSTWTLVACGILIILSCVSPFLVTWYYDLPANIGVTSQDYMKMYYYVTHTRFGPWVIGFVLGYIIFKVRKNKNFKMNNILVLLAWLVSMTVLATVVFAPFNITQHAYDRFESSIFNALHRNVWGLALCWIIFACVQGYGGPVNWFLSLSIFEILGRFTYTMYLVHLSLEFGMIAASKDSVYFSDANTMFIYWSYVILSFAIAVVLTLMFESPIVILEKVIFSPAKKKTPLIPPVREEAIEPNKEV